MTREPLKRNISLKRHFFSKRIFEPTLRKLAIIVVLAAIFVFLYFFVIKDIPSTTKIGKLDYPQSTNIFDRNNVLLYSIYDHRNQIYVPYDKIPQDLKEATVAIEDRDFFNH